MRLWTFGVMVALAASPADGDKPTRVAKPPGKGFWKVLVRPHAKWVLYRDPSLSPVDNGTSTAPITIETYDVRKVGNADVARLRWRQGSYYFGISGLDQLAVTADGLYMLSSEMDDAEISLRLKDKPSRPDPPEPYQGPRATRGDYVEIRDDLVCMGEGPVPGEPPCDGTCYGEVCISATQGIVRLDGLWAPNKDVYIQTAK